MLATPLIILASVFAAGSADDVIGHWDLQYALPGGQPRQLQVTVARDTAGWLGWSHDARGRRVLSRVGIEDGQLVIVYTPEDGGSGPLITFRSAINDGRLRGEATAVDYDEKVTLEFSGRKKLPTEEERAATTNWQLTSVIKSGDQEVRVVMTLSMTDLNGKVTGWVRGYPTNDGEVSQSYDYPVEIELEGKEIRFTSLSRKGPEEYPQFMDFKGILEGDTIKGTVDYQHEATKMSWEFFGQKQ